MSDDHAPLIVNCTKHSIVVFQERGAIFNKQHLLPGEAVNITRRETAGILPYYFLHAVIGDETSIPDKMASMKSLATRAAIPTAFVVGALAAAVSAGVLTGPALALAPLINGLVIQGVVIDAAAIGAGSALATKMALASETIVEKFENKFMTKTDRVMNGNRYMAVMGGVDDGPLEIMEMKRDEYQKMSIAVTKNPIP